MHERYIFGFFHGTRVESDKCHVISPYMRCTCPFNENNISERAKMSGLSTVKGDVLTILSDAFFFNWTCFQMQHRWSWKSSFWKLVLYHRKRSYISNFFDKCAVTFWKRKLPFLIYLSNLSAFNKGWYFLCLTKKSLKKPSRNRSNKSFKREIKYQTESGMVHVIR